MSTVITKICDRCGKKPINQDYTVHVSISALLPEGGGWSTGHELNEYFDYCQDCKKIITNTVLPILRVKS